MGKFVNALGAVNAIRNSENPGQAAGNLAAGAAMVAHPIIGTMAAPLIRRGAEAAVNKGIQFAQDPAVQAKVQEIGSRVSSSARDMGSRVSSSIRDVVDNGRAMTFQNSSGSL